MYTIHPDFYDIPNETIIWKYMDLFKYLDLIKSKKLFLSRIDTFHDKYEGKGLSREEIHTAFDVSPTDKFTQAIISSNEMLKKISYVSSWHINDNESSVMWDAYSNNNGGIAIKSTVGALKQSITSDENIYISRIQYDRSKLDLKNFYKPILFKRPEFQEEKEVRVFFVENINKVLLKEIDINALPKFKKININPDTLIEAAYYHPLTVDWVIESINSIIGDYGPTPVKSSLYS